MEVEAQVCCLYFYRRCYLCLASYASGKVARKVARHTENPSSRWKATFSLKTLLFRRAAGKDNLLQILENIWFWCVNRVHVGKRRGWFFTILTFFRILKVDRRFKAKKVAFRERNTKFHGKSQFSTWKWCPRPALAQRFWFFCNFHAASAFSDVYEVYGSEFVHFGRVGSRSKVVHVFQWQSVAFRESKTGKTEKSSRTLILDR